MSLPDRNNSYSFDAFLEWRAGCDYYADDPFLQSVVRHHAGSAYEHVDEEARRFSKLASTRWRDLAEEAARPANRPYVMHYDGYGRRIDRIVRPLQTEVLEREVFSQGFFAHRTNPWTRLLWTFLFSQNGEACVVCPLACTEGLVALLSCFAETPELRSVLTHLTEGRDGEYGIGAQYISEIHGGSDVQANLVEAVSEEGRFRLYGTKFFCSATHADYALVTAKPCGSEEVGLFLVPSYLPDDAVRERRNGHTIDRIKEKLGTSELTTAEITYDGALAWPVGPLDRGLANVVGMALTISRLNVGIAAAASMTRAVREARRYGEHREAFGQPIAHFPMVAGQLARMERFSRRTVAGAFKLYGAYLGLAGGLRGGLASEEPLEARRQRFLVRELIMLQKIAAALDATDVIRSALSVFGGHGVMEDFSALPRLYRDAAVNELWEGPRNVLLTQIHRDLQRSREWFPPEEVVAALLEGNEPVATSLGAELTELLRHPSLLARDDRTNEVCGQWDDYCQRLCHAWQDVALSEVEAV
ncbi:acyl-CoA dehydrogenase family protein [Planctomycetota bacterium]